MQATFQPLRSIHKLSRSVQIPPMEGRARAGLLDSSYPCLRSISCRLKNAVMTLRGQVPTYFHKQVAQTVVRQRVGNSVAIDNQLRVVRANGPVFRDHGGNPAD